MEREAAQQEWPYHDSWQVAFRRPFGAVSCGSEVELSFQQAPGEALRQVTLRLWQEGAGERLLPLQPAAGGRWSLKLKAPPEPGWLWYYFVVQGQDGQLWYYGAQEDGLGGAGHRRLQPSPRSWQITVHRQRPLPAWLTDGIIYQIFPDRFCNGHADGRITGAQPGSLLHAHWEDTPFYVRDAATGQMVGYDFFGGNLEGICAKLPYLAELGVTILYLNPIFLSASNHRYDVADYQQVDPMLGDAKTLRKLCRKARSLGMAVLLDGVFSHTGSDSVYFNKEGRFPGEGAYQSLQSPYASWYRFSAHPDKYECWWGVDTMPNVEELAPSYLDFIIRGEHSVLRRWLRCGIKGWRLDVVDELPDAFLAEFYRTLKQEDAEAVLIGEVWEDASRKVSYGQMRRYLLGDELDATMNYPFRTVMVDFFLGRLGAAQMLRALRALQEHYPPPHFYGAMNLIGSHDVPRILTELGEAPPPEGLSEKERGRYRLPPAQRLLACRRLKVLTLWQLTFPGVPSIYYGDEAGLEGYRDPFNRGSFPWGREDEELTAWYKLLVSLRRRHGALRGGAWVPLAAEGDSAAFLRVISGGRDALGRPGEDEVLLVAVNRHVTEERQLTLRCEEHFKGRFVSLLGEDLAPVAVRDGAVTLRLPPLTGVLLRHEEASVLPRGAGLLLHPTSLPGPYGGGDLGPAAREFVDFLARAGQRWWQMLPLNPPGPASCGSPYQALSAFAGHVALLSPDDLVRDGWLQPEELAPLPEAAPGEAVDFAAVTAYKERLVRQAFARFQARGGRAPGYEAFVRRQADWLEDYALFRAAKDRYGGAPWTQWPLGVQERRPAALEELVRQEREALAWRRFEQYLFFQQAQRLREYAAQRGVRLLGDLPLYVAHDSSDVWSRRHFFRLDAAGEPTQVAGVPPDYFSADGQLWGNPLYDWEALAGDGYRWWQRRLEVLLELVDWVRIDHFRGIESYWVVPAGAATAAGGRWQPGPGGGLLEALRQADGTLPLLAEDLGVITPEVDALKEAFSLPGMTVLQFAFRQDEAGRLKAPFIPRNSVIYTGTHDNDTSRSWFEQLARQQPALASDVARLLKVRGGGAAAVVRALAVYAYGSGADVVMLPVQDVLGLGREGRMNVPGVARGNWSWRLQPGELGERQARWLAELVRHSGRAAKEGRRGPAPDER